MVKRKVKIKKLIALLLCLAFVVSCKKTKVLQETNVAEQNKQENETNHLQASWQNTENPLPTEEPVVYINSAGACLKERIRVPDGFVRMDNKKNSFGEFLANYPMCEDGQPVLLYDGTKKANQNAHIAVFDMDVTEGDLQQCADSIMRMYAEYFYQQKQYEKIKFHFVNGFSCDFDKWSQGMRVKIDGNKTSWYQGGQADASKETLEKYLRVVFSYASTLSMEQESEPITIGELRVGDLFIRGGSPGHVVMVADVCENEKGEKAFLLAQGYMPAQQFHIIKNPAHEENPWYYETELTYPFRTAEYSFDEGSLRRPEYN